jgi:hypothetical protein
VIELHALVTRTLAAIARKSPSHKLIASLLLSFCRAFSFINLLLLVLARGSSYPPSYFSCVFLYNKACSTQRLHLPSTTSSEHQVLLQLTVSHQTIVPCGKYSCSPLDLKSLIKIYLADLSIRSAIQPDQDVRIHQKLLHLYFVYRPRSTFLRDLS